MEVTVGSTRIETKRAIKYLGVIIDDRLNFKEVVKYFGERTSVTRGALATMMPNIGEPGPFKRRIISTVLTSIMPDACPMWSEELSVGTTRMILPSVDEKQILRAELLRDQLPNWSLMLQEVPAQIWS